VPLDASASTFAPLGFYPAAVPSRAANMPLAIGGSGSPAHAPRRIRPASFAPPAAGSVSWDQIVSIEYDGIEDVYDLTVEGLHSFVARDIIVHNSIEQDADLVMFLYRDEYYNDQSDDQGLAEIILAKHRNGPVGTEKLAFLKRFAKFADLAPQHDARAAA
jgi:replicative DNA helicase